MDRTVNYVPLPAEYIYRTLGPVRQKLSRVLLYIVQSFTDRDMDTETYLACHSVVGAAWRRMNDDSEFCEQLELDLPTRTPTLSGNEAVPRLIPICPQKTRLRRHRGL